jgi:hypothetical protein
MNATHDGVEVRGVEVLEVGGVGNLLRRPDTLVVGVIDQRRSPLALVSRVRLHRAHPRSTPRAVGALGVRNSRRDPVTVLLIVPLLGLLRVGIRDRHGLVSEPALGLDGLGVRNLARRILIPVLGLGRSGVGHLGLVDPCAGLLVLGVVDLLVGVDGGLEALEEVALGVGLVVDEDLERVVGAGESVLE